MSMLSGIFWRAGALFAVSLALIASGAMVLVMIYLLMLADLSENRGEEAFGQVLLLRGGIAQTMNKEFGLNPNPDLRRMPNTLPHGSNSSDRSWQMPVHSADDRTNDYVARGTRSPRS
jgi:hypothetical protein